MHSTSCLGSSVHYLDIVKPSGGNVLPTLSCQRPVFPAAPPARFVPAAADHLEDLLPAAAAAAADVLAPAGCLGYAAFLQTCSNHEHMALVVLR